MGADGHMTTGARYPTVPVVVGSLGNMNTASGAPGNSSHETGWNERLGTGPFWEIKHCTHVKASLGSG